MQLENSRAIAISLHHLTLTYLAERDFDSLGMSKGLVKNYLSDLKAVEEVK